MYKCIVPVLKVRNEGFSSLYRGFFPTWTRLVSSHPLTHVHTHSHMYKPTHTCTHPLIHVHTHSHMYTPTHTCTHPLTHVHTQSHMYTPTHTCTHPFTHVHTHSHMYTPTHTCTHPHFTGSMVNDILDNSRADQDISRN